MNELNTHYGKNIEDFSNPKTYKVDLSRNLWNLKTKMIDSKKYNIIIIKGVINMDITDYKIIEILQEEGRISMKDLGKIVGLTSPAVSERVKRLEEVRCYRRI